MKVVINYISYIHYRDSLFEELNNIPDLDLKIICGDTSPVGVKNVNNLNAIIVNNYYLNIWKYKFIWQSHISKRTVYESPDIVIMLGFNPLIISSIISFLIYKLNGIKIFWWGHGTLGGQGKIGKLFRLIFYKYSDGVLVYDKKGKDRLLQSGINKNKLHVIKNCINYDQYGHLKFSMERLKRFKKYGNKFKIIFLGRLTKDKEVSLLISALNRLQTQIEFELTIIGEGEELKYLSYLVKELKLEKNVKFKGPLYENDLDDILLRSHLFVHPGSIGLALIHSFSYGIPVITHNEIDKQKPEISAMIPGKTGEFYERNNIEDLMLKIKIVEERMKKNICYYFHHCITQSKMYHPKIVARNIYNAIKYST